MGLTRPGEETVYVHPTFLYESLWNLVGFIIIDRYWYQKGHRKYDGQIFLFYVFWYGTGRAMVEGLRTDSLYIPGTNIRTSQLVAACSAVIALVVLLVNIKRTHKPTFVSVQAAAQAAVDEAVSEEAAAAESTGAQPDTAAAQDGAEPESSGTETSDTKINNQEENHNV